MQHAFKSDSPVPMDDRPIQLKAPRRSAMGSVIGHTGFNVARYHITHVFGALFPLLAGVLVFGWRAAICVFLVIGSTLLAGLVWRRIGMRGHPMRPSQLLWFGMVLALMLPAELLSNSLWPILPIAALLLVMFCWAVGGTASGRFHPVLVVYLFLAILYPSIHHPDLVLQGHRLVAGDLLDAPRQREPRALQIAWRRRPIFGSHDALCVVPAAESLHEFTQSQHASDGSRMSLDTMLRDYVPPLEDCALGAVPGGIGVTSAVAVIIGGLFLLYRGLIDYRIPLLIVLTAWITLIALPIPAGPGDHPQWHWFAGRLKGVGWAEAVTLADYQILASPLLFTAFFLAGSPTIRPLTRKGRAIYAVLLGILAAGLQVYFSVGLGSYFALLAVGLLTPFLDRCIFGRPLV